MTAYEELIAAGWKVEPAHCEFVAKNPKALYEHQVCSKCNTRCDSPLHREQWIRPCTRSYQSFGLAGSVSSHVE
jgi:hypothetical protein